MIAFWIKETLIFQKWYYTIVFYIVLLSNTMLTVYKAKRMIKWYSTVEFLPFFSSIFCIILLLPRNLDWNIEINSNIFLKQSNTYIDILGKSLGEFFFLFSTNIYFSVVLGEIIVLERYALLVLKTRGRKTKRKKFKIKNQNSNWVRIIWVK